jgi:hypothetical protein
MDIPKLYAEYKKAFMAALAAAGVISAALADWSLTTEEGAAIGAALVGVYLVWKARNEVL